MTSIDFDEASEGNVSSSAGTPALTIRNSGDGGGLLIAASGGGTGLFVAGSTDSTYPLGDDIVDVPAFEVENVGISGRFSSGYGTAIVASAEGPGVSIHATSSESTCIKAESGDFGTGNANPTIMATNTDGGAILCEDKGHGTAIKAVTDSGVGIYAYAGRHLGGRPLPPPQGPLAGYFVGNVQVTGDILLSNADCAEEFEVESGNDALESGTVMVLNESGNLEQSCQAYDKKVAGVISGAGDYKPGIILDRKDKVDSSNRLPIALMGKTYCKVDATYAVIEIGDLLTTSPTHGHAMKATDPLKAFGAVIGKALRSLKAGKGLIPILVVLQ